MGWSTATASTGSIASASESVSAPPPWSPRSPARTTSWLIPDPEANTRRYNALRRPPTPAQMCQMRARSHGEHISTPSALDTPPQGSSPIHLDHPRLGIQRMMLPIYLLTCVDPARSGRSLVLDVAAVDRGCPSWVVQSGARLDRRPRQRGMRSITKFDGRLGRVLGSSLAWR